MWATLLTNSDYLAGCLVLAQSLHAVKSAYPLVVLVTPALPLRVSEILRQYGLETRPVDYLEPQGGWNGQKTLDHRFIDTWTKLAVFGLEEYEQIILLDSDMLVRQNMDELMAMNLPKNHIAASHACTCNPRKLSHYPADWSVLSLVYMPLLTRSLIIGFQKIVPTHMPRLWHLPPSLRPPPPTFHLLNSGLVVLSPSQELFHDMAYRLQTDPSVKDFVFPDQDFLAMYYKGRFLPLSYRYNALKPMQHCHASLWSNQAIKNIHYIIDKPWARRPQPEDLYYTVHSWWWQAYDQLKADFKTDDETWAIIASGVEKDKRN